MTQIAGTHSTYDAVGNREDLQDTIYNIAPTETPFLSRAAQLKASATKHEWQTDTLAAAAANAVIEGDEATIDSVVATVRVGNYCQISDKTVIITGTQEVVTKAGRKSEISYRVAQRGKELKRDMEFALTQEVASVAGSDTVARKSAGIEAWITTNDSRGGGAGAQGGWNSGTGVVDAPTDGTQRAFTEDLLKTVLRSAWTAGGNPSLIMMGPVNRQKFSAFTGNATRFDKSEDKVLVATVGVYESDFGKHTVVANRFSRDRSALVLDMEYWGVAYLRRMGQWELAKTGDAEKRQLLAEYCLVSKNEAASGIVADLTTS